MAGKWWLLLTRRCVINIPSEESIIFHVAVIAAPSETSAQQTCSAARRLAVSARVVFFDGAKAATY